MTANSYTVPVLLDMYSQVMGQYGVTGTPTTFFIDSGGVIRYVKVGAFASQAELQQDLGTIT